MNMDVLKPKDEALLSLAMQMGLIIVADEVQETQEIPTEPKPTENRPCSHPS